MSERCILGIRPEDLVISRDSIAGGMALDLTVEAIERVGAETFIYGTPPPGVAAATPELTGEVIVRIPGAGATAIGAIRGDGPARKTTSVQRGRLPAD